MSCFSGPEIVNDGLVLHLDAANQRSYPGSGTVWTDLSGNGNNGTLVNGVGYNSSNKGSLSFDGVDDYISGNLGTLNAPFTMEYFGKFNSALNASYYEYFGHLGGINSPNTMISVAKIRSTSMFAGGTAGYMYMYDGANPIRVNANLATTEWLHICVVLLSSSPYALVYVDGEEKSLLDSMSGPINTNGFYCVGEWNYNHTWKLNGRIGISKVYNRALSASEIQQNFQATRDRYQI